jgi:predicted transglutaminase-like cysteine proteinase
MTKANVFIIILLMFLTGCATIHKRGYVPVDRTTDYQEFVKTMRTMTEKEKVVAVNDFFNSFLYATDAVVYKKNDYWATPNETIKRGAGDCEDLALAKYFTLIHNGVSASKLRLAYAKLDGQAHMIVIYDETLSEKYLVLDNYDLDIKELNKRKDIEVVYTFNSHYVWTTDFKKPTSVNKLGLWLDLVTRIGAIV